MSEVLNYHSAFDQPRDFVDDNGEVKTLADAPAEVELTDSFEAEDVEIDVLDTSPSVANEPTTEQRRQKRIEDFADHLYDSGRYTYEEAMQEAQRRVG